MMAIINGGTGNNKENSKRKTNMRRYIDEYFETPEEQTLKPSHEELKSRTIMVIRGISQCPTLR